jgi:aspartyl-tRNA(Asn)/glutamyl-tRNA(Gln) amidotransferase subunit C
MKLSHAEVEHIAKLARLELTEEEKVRYGGQLSAILDHVAELQKLDTSSIPPMTAVIPAQNAHRPDLPSGGLRADDSHLRPDRSRPSMATEELLKNAPAHEQEQFKIPPVFE